MRTRASYLSLLAAVWFAALLAGCGGGSPSVPQSPSGSNTGSSSSPAVQTTPLVSNNTQNPQKPGSFSPQPGVDYIYIANPDANAIDIFPLNVACGGQAGTITSGIQSPWGLWFDTTSRELYVANQNNTVTVYAFGSVTPARTYSQGLDAPLFPITDRNGNLYVSSQLNGTVVEYLAGTTTVARTLQTPGTEADGLAFDKQGNLYVAYRKSDAAGDAGVEEFAPGSNTGNVLGMSLTAPQGIVVDTNGNIVVTETQIPHRIDVFPPGSTTPSFETTIPNSNQPGELAIDSNEANLYVSITGRFSNQSGAYGTKYPLPGQSFFLQDQVSGSSIPGVTISNNQNF